MNPDLIAVISHSLEIHLPENKSFEEVNEILACHINEMIWSDFPGLVSLLYRMDVSESKLKQMLQDRKGDDAGKIIAGLIIERMEQKIKTRKQQGTPGSAGAELEEW